MSEKRFCPECNAPINDEDRFCDNCGASLIGITDNSNTDNSNTGNSSTEENVGAISTNRDTEGDNIVRSNITGGVTKTTNTTTNNNLTTNKVDNSTSTVTNNSTVNNASSSVDNSTVNNTTIVMNGKADAEFCEVCGNPFEGKHARCPKCGKSICFDCKVKGKNRCVECEKKAVNEYRLAFQELLMTTNGEIGVAGRQMMNRKAQELDVEDKKKSIEAELVEMYKPKQKAEQPTVIPAAPTATRQQQASRPAQTEKGVGSISGGTIIQPPVSNTKKESGSSKSLMFIICGVVIAAAAFFVLSGGDKDKPSAEPKEAAVVNEVKKEMTAQEPAKEAEKTVKTAEAVKETPAKETAAKSEPAVKETPKPAPAVDNNYTAGMEAYDKGNGREALKFFEKSNSAESLYMIGLIYESGCGSISKNPMKAVQYFKKAAKLGHEGAKARI